MRDELRAWLNEQHPRPWWQQAADWLWWHLGRIWR